MIHELNIKAKTSHENRRLKTRYDLASDKKGKKYSTEITENCMLL